MSIEYAKIFIKVAFSNKIGLIMILIIPTILMLFNNKEWISNSPSYEELLMTTGTWWGYIISISTVSGIGANLLILREQGFLKLFKFISGSTFPIFLGNVIAQLIFASVSLLLFNIVVAIAFKGPITTLLLISLVLILITIIPLSLFVIWIPSLPFNQETITSLAALVIFPLLFITTNTFSSDKIYSMLLLLNPLEVVQQISRLLLNTIFNYNLEMDFPLISIIIFLIIYTGIGIYFLPKIKIKTVKTRS